MKKITLFMTLFIAATMNIFAQDAQLRLLSTIPSSNDEIEGISTSWEFVFSEAAKVADDAVKKLEIKNEANDVIACVSLVGVGTYENSIFTGIAANDTIWGEWYDDYKGETVKYIEQLIYPTGLDVPGIYTMTIPAGTFVSAQDNSVAIAETTLTYNVIAPQPKWWTDYDYSTTVKEFETITISFENVKEIKLTEGVAPVLYTSAGSEYIGTAELVEEVDEKEGKTTYRIMVSFGEKFSEEGEYYIMIPAEMFTMNNEVSNDEKQITLTILPPVDITPLEFVSITPTEGEAGQIEKIVITFNQDVALAFDENWQPISSVIYLKDQEGNEYKMTENYNWSLGWNQLEYICGGYDENWNMILAPITAEGVYKLDLSQIVVQYGYDKVSYTYGASGSVEKTITWTIGENTAIEGIEAEAENAEIYDLTGRRVEKITNAGIYIVNGVKKVIK